MPSDAVRPQPRRLGAALAGVAVALPLVLLGPAAGAASAQETPEQVAPSAVQGSPSPRPTGLVPLPGPEEQPTEEPVEEPEVETPEPEAPPTTAAPTRRPRRTLPPAPVLTALATPTPSAEATPTPTPTPSATGLRTLPPPVEADILQPVPSSTPASAQEPAEEPVDPVTRGLRTALATAVLLGAAGVAGLYLTRERP